MNAYEILNKPKHDYDPNLNFLERTNRALESDKRTFSKDVTDTVAFERSALPKIISGLERVRKPKFLDAGCGYGRHIPFIAPLVEKYVAVEPCLPRLQYAQEHTQAENVEFVHSPVQDYTTKYRFHFTWLCNVIQHLPIGLKIYILGNIHLLMTKRSKLLLWEGRILDESWDTCAEIYQQDSCPAHMIPMPFECLEDEFVDCEITRLDPPAFILIERK